MTMSRRLVAPWRHRDLRARSMFGRRRRSSAPTTAPGERARERRAAAPSEAAAEPVTITWYHIQNNDPGLSLWKTLADEYTAAHPNVTIDIQVLENEAFKTKLTTLLQQGDVPDLFQTWGGGGLASRSRPASSRTSPPTSRTGRTPSTPAPSACTRSTARSTACRSTSAWSASGTNKAFTEAGITTPPATWDELLDDRPDAQGQGHHPDRPRRQGQVDRRLLLGVPGGPRVRPGRHGQGRHDRRLVRSVLRQGRRGVQEARSTWSRSRKASSPRRGTAPAARRPRRRPTTAPCSSWASGSRAPCRRTPATPAPWARASAGSRSRPSTGGAGRASDGVRRRQRLRRRQGRAARGRRLPASYLVSLDVAKQWGALNSGILPTTNGSEASATDPMLTPVLEGRAKAKFVQLYLDQATTPELGGAINEAVADAVRRHRHAADPWSRPSRRRRCRQ